MPSRVRVSSNFTRVGQRAKKNTRTKLGAVGAYIRKTAQFRIRRSPIRRWKKRTGGWVGGHRKNRRFGLGDLAYEPVRDKAGHVIKGKNGKVIFAPVLLNREQTRAKPGESPLTHIYDVTPSGRRQTSKGIKKSIYFTHVTQQESVLIGTTHSGVVGIGGIMEFGEGNHADHPFMRPALVSSEQYIKQQFNYLL